jgi:glycosyltransferase involved in cell wall biosynthesis
LLAKCPGNTRLRGGSTDAGLSSGALRLETCSMGEVPVRPEPRLSRRGCGARGHSRIAVAYHGRYPFNRGIHLVAVALVAAGHEIVVFSNAAASDPAVGEEGGIVIRYFPYFLRYPVVRRIAALHWGLNPFWLAWLGGAFRKGRFDLLWVRDLPLMLSLIPLRALGVRIVFDMRENYPAMLSSDTRTRWFHHLTRNRFLLQRLEDIATRFCDHVMVVTEAQRERLISRGVDADKVSVNVTTPRLSFVQAAASVARREAGVRPLRVIYAGQISERRGLDAVLAALAVSRPSAEDFELTIVGESGPERDALQATVESLDLGKTVVFPPMQPFESLLEFLAEYDVGLIPHVVDDHTCTTIPGKLFEYMAAGLMVLSSDLPPVAGVVEEEAAGLIVRKDGPDGFAEAFAALLSLPAAEIRAMGLRGREAVLRTYHWETQGAAIERVVEELTQPAK